MKTIVVVQNQDVANSVTALLQKDWYSSTVLAVADAAGVIRSRKHTIGDLTAHSPWLFLEFRQDLSHTPMSDIAAAYLYCRIKRSRSIPAI